MINPIKWPKANLQSKLFNWVKWNLVWQFLATMFIPLLYLVNIAIAAQTPASFNAPFWVEPMGIFIAAIGLAFWIISYISLGKNFGVLPQKQKRIKKGIYKYIKHPMYDGIYMTFAGLSLANRSWQGLVFLNLIILPLLIVRAFFEEKNLTD